MQILEATRKAVLITVGTFSLFLFDSNAGSAFVLYPNQTPPVNIVEEGRHWTDQYEWRNLYPNVWGKTHDSFLDRTTLSMEYPVVNSFYRRYGCPEICSSDDFFWQYRVGEIVWPAATYTVDWGYIFSGTYAALGPNFEFPEEFEVTYDEAYVRQHELVHVRQAQEFIVKHIKPLENWARTYTGGWFNSREVAQGALELEFRLNYFSALTSAQEEYDKIFLDSEHGTLDSEHGTLDSEHGTKGRVKTSRSIDSAGPISVEDEDPSWRDFIDDAIRNYKPEYAIYQENGDEPVPCPAPLPILGISVVWSFSRRLRKLSRELRNSSRKSGLAID
jgi:hypothetical protein